MDVRLGRVESGVEKLGERVGGVEQGIAKLDGRIGRNEAQLDSLEVRVDARFSGLDSRLITAIGINIALWVTTMAAVVVGIVTIIVKV